MISFDNLRKSLPSPIIFLWNVIHLPFRKSAYDLLSPNFNNIELSRSALSDYTQTRCRVIQAWRKSSSSFSNIGEDKWDNQITGKFPNRALFHVLTRFVARQRRPMAFSTHSLKQSSQVDSKWYVSQKAMFIKKQNSSEYFSSSRFAPRHWTLINIETLKFWWTSSYPEFQINKGLLLLIYFK